MYARIASRNGTGASKIKVLAALNAEPCSKEGSAVGGEKGLRTDIYTHFMHSHSVM